MVDKSFNTSLADFVTNYIISPNFCAFYKCVCCVLSNRYTMAVKDFADICDWICEKGSYSLSNCMYLAIHIT